MKVEITLSETGISLFHNVPPLVVDLALPSFSGVIGAFVDSQIAGLEFSLVSVTVVDGDALLETVTLADTVPFLPGIVTLYTNRVPLAAELLSIFNAVTNNAGLSVAARGKVLADNGHLRSA